MRYSSNDAVNHVILTYVAESRLSDNVIQIVPNSSITMTATKSVG